MGTINGVRVGLNDLYYALLTTDASGGAVYATPVAVTGAITANINPNSVIASLFADDGPMIVTAQLGDITLELNVADIPLYIQAIMLGHTAPVEGYIYRKSTDTPPWIAIGFKAIKSNGHYRYVWMLKGKFGEPELTHQTKEDTVNYQTTTITGNFVKRDYDDAWIKQADADETSWVATTGTTWFTDGPDAP